MGEQASSAVSSVHLRRHAAGTGDRTTASAALLAITIFLSAFLLFQVQPIAARYILPWFGGGPAVWTSCLLFFQIGLLGGYLYAHWLGSLSSSRVTALMHIGLLTLSLAFLPIRPSAAIWKTPSALDPSVRIVLLLAATVGGPYLLLSATGPLLQRWFVLSGAGRSPWKLYALSNLGSLLALVSYPFVVEPRLRLDTQVQIWSGLYLLFASLCGVVAWRVGSVPWAPSEESEQEPTARPTVGAVVFWVALAACGSTILVATTNQIS